MDRRSQVVNFTLTPDQAMKLLGSPYAHSFVSVRNATSHISSIQFQVSTASVLYILVLLLAKPSQQHAMPDRVSADMRGPSQRDSAQRQPQGPQEEAWNCTASQSR